MSKKQKFDGADPVVVSDEHSGSDSDSDSYMDMEPRSGDEPCTSSEGETLEVGLQKSKEQTAWTAEEALKYYNKLHQGVEYVLVDPIRSNAVFAPCGIFCHSLFKAKKVVVPSPSSGSGSSVGSSCPATPKMVIDDGSSSIPVETSPPTHEVVVNSDSGSSSSSSTPSLSPTTTVELFFAETAMYSHNNQGMDLTVHACVIIDTSGTVPPNIGCFYCSRSPKNPFYHPPEEQLEFGKHNCDKGFKYDDDDWTSSDDEPEVPCLVPPHLRSRKI